MLSYSLEGDDADSFEIVSTSGQLQTKDDVTYNYEEKNSYVVRVKVVDSQGGSKTIAVTISLIDVNEAPVFTSAATFEVKENNTTVGAVSANDEDSDDSITGYAITGGVDQAQFEITDEGGLRFKAAPNYEVPADVESADPANVANNNEYIVEVTATGGASERVLTAAQTITVTVTDKDDEAPGQVETPVVSEATLNSLKVTWTAPANTGPEITDYDVQYKASDDDGFTDADYDGTDLTLTLTGLKPGTSYEVQVRAENDEGSGTWSDSDSGTTDANVAPVFTSAATFEVKENNTTVGAVSANDEDSDDSITGYAITGGVDQAQFEITDEGALRFKAAPNYEVPADVESTDPANAANNNEYIVEVTATGGASERVLTAAQTITVTVSDKDDEAPSQPAALTVAEATLNSLKVAWTAPTNTGPAISAYDVRYILTSVSTADKTDDTKWTVSEGAWQSDMHTDLAYTLSGLSQGTSYDVQVRAKNDEGTGVWSDSSTGTTLTDDDGLIEVATFAQLNAIRYDLDGNGEADDSAHQSDYTSAFPNAASGMGCPQSGCTGYKLTTDLDFNDSAWTMGSGWEPIGTDTNRFTAIFDGGGNILSNLFIDRTGDAGLFGTSSGIIKNVGLIDVNVEGSATVGSLLGSNRNEVSNCFATGQVSSATGTAGGLVGTNRDTIRTSYSRANVVNTRNGGGLVGNNEGALLACYATGEVSTNRSAGGLVGWNPSSASIKYCYATGSVSSSGTGADGQRVGGFFGGLQSPWSSREYGLSYWNKETTGRSSRAGDRFITHSNHQKIRNNIKGKTTSQLQSPTGYTDIYASWDDEDVTSDGIADAPWDFGTMSQYPFLKVDFDGDGMATSQEFGPQRVLGAPTIFRVTFNGGQLTVVWTWTAPSEMGNSDITAYDVRYIRITDDETDDNNWTLLDNIWRSGSLDLEYTMPMDDGIYEVQVRAEDANSTGPWSETMFTHSSTWVDFVQAKANGTEPILPDFSYAGYHYFAKPVPTVTHTVFDVTDYGAVANDNKSDHSAIQAAIDAATENGSGIVFFPPGEFLINTDEDYPGSSIRITSSNIVLRGSGSKDGGTIIRQVNYLRDPKWSTDRSKENSPFGIEFDGSGPSTVLTTITEDADREGFWITVADPSVLQVGQKIVLKMRSVVAGRSFIAPRTAPNNWTVIRNDGLIVHEEHSIAEIFGSAVRLNEPLHMYKLMEFHIWEVHSFPHIEEVGLEDISLQGSFLERFDHGRNDIHNSGWGPVLFRNCYNSWMRRVSILNSTRIGIYGCLGFSAYHITADGNPGHYFIRNRTNYGTWIGLSEDLCNHLHSTNCMSHTTGTVYYKVFVPEGALLDCHTWFPYANLYDNMDGGYLYGSSGAIHSFPNHLRHLGSSAIFS